MTNTSEDHLSLQEIRPRFRVESSHSVADLTDKINVSLKKENASCIGEVDSGHGTLFIPKKEQHYWSPQLTLTLENTDNGSLLRGMYGPRPTVWTMFIFFYFLIGLATSIVVVVGLSFISLGKSGTILWLAPVLILIFLSLYLVAHFGKKMGKSQIAVLHKFLEGSTGLSI